jgi:hypothetical protein
MNLTQTLLLCILLIISFSCGRNPLKNDEKGLRKQILTEEERLTQEANIRAEREKKLADSIAKLPKGFRFKEDRSIDPLNPPVVIDIIGNRSNPKRIKLSQLFSSIEYVRLEKDPDSALYNQRFSTIISPNHIYTVSVSGSIFQFDRKGHFIQEICKGNLQYTDHKGGGIMVTKEQTDQFEGARDAYWNGNKLSYQYVNTPGQKTYLVSLDDQVGSEFSSLQLPGSVESKNLINGKGKITAELKKNPSVYSLPTAYLLNNNMFSFAQQLKPVEHPSNFINVISSSGDTLCEFKDYDPIRGFSKSVSRGVDQSNSYYLDGILHVRQAFNDTIYCLIPPNRLIPKYVLNFGSLGIKTALEGIDPGYNLKDKLVLYSFLETNRYLFITYTKDYYCLATAKKGTLKFSKLIYDKKNRTLTLIYLDEPPLLSNGGGWLSLPPSPPSFFIENDLDGMPFRWPSSVTPDGNPFSRWSGEDILKSKVDLSSPVKNIRKTDRIIAIYH